MAKGISWADQAKSDLRAIAQPTALNILRGITRFLVDGEGGVKVLKGIHPSESRLRFGDYRVRFYDYGESVKVLRVRHRKDVYR